MSPSGIKVQASPCIFVVFIGEYHSHGTRLALLVPLNNFVRSMHAAELLNYILNNFSTRYWIRLFNKFHSPAQSKEDLLYAEAIRSVFGYEPCSHARSPIGDRSNFASSYKPPAAASRAFPTGQ